MKVTQKNGIVTECSFDDALGKEAFRHTSAHILAQAVKRLYPDTKCAIGPAIENGFYYDFEFSFPFTEKNLSEIEKEMKAIVKQSLPLVRSTVSREEAIKVMKERQESYKVEMIEELHKDAVISFYQQGEYTEFCAGPHVSNTCLIKAFKLTSVAGAYWHGDEHGKMLTRIYGTSFPKASELNEYLQQLEEAKLRDHRKLGKELGLFTIMEEGPGFPFFLPKGLILKNLLLDYWRKLHKREGYVEISTPLILNRSLWETSGHWDHYRDKMYTTVIDGVDFAIKPMNCPGGMLVYKMQPHSYRELPMRIGELGIVHRNEKSGELHGLMRARCFTQDDAHIFMTRDQITDEIKGVIRLINEVYSRLGFSYHVELSTRPKDSIGSDEDWEAATNGLIAALNECNMKYVVNEGDGAFYGPKIDFHLKDSLNRTWQCGTIQLDFQLPQRFGAEYIGPDGKKYQPIMIHRVIFGSVERFLGILIEHYAGKFPVWLAPVQVKILPVSGVFAQDAKALAQRLTDQGIRVETDERDEKLGYKIRKAQMDKVPYMIIFGQKEKDEQNIAVRSRDHGDLGSMSESDFIYRIKEEEKQ